METTLWLVLGILILINPMFWMIMLIVKEEITSPKERKGQSVSLHQDSSSVQQPDVPEQATNSYPLDEADLRRWQSSRTPKKVVRKKDPFDE